MKVAVVTPTIGSLSLEKCIESIQNQTHANLIHYIFLDGEEHYEKIHPSLLNRSRQRTIKTISLQENIGKGWYGHRVYAACSFLVNADVICYLDEDNWFEPEHVERLVEIIEQGNDWAFSLRKIYDREGNYLCEDNCESLGKWPVYFNDQIFHIDTSSFAVKRDVAIRIGHSWYGKWGADRQFFHNIRHHFSKFDCTGFHTLCYRLDGNQNSVNKEFFDKGNEIQIQKYNGKFPWNSKKEHDQILQPIIIGPGIQLV